MAKFQDKTDPTLPEPGPGGRSLSRRALLRIGWIVPVVLAVGIPRDAFAQYGEDPPYYDDDKDKDRGRDRGRDDDKKDKGGKKDKNRRGRR
jgi:hypothetical protein